MRPEFIKNMYRLVAANEGKAWEFRCGQDSVAVGEEIAKELVQKYSSHVVANTKYTGNGAYSMLDPEAKAAVDMYIIDHNLVGL